MLRGRLTAEMCCESLGVYTCCLHPSIHHLSVLMDGPIDGLNNIDILTIR